MHNNLNILVSIHLRRTISDLAWTLTAFYGRPRQTLMYRKTIESLTNEPPATIDDYLKIPEISKNKSMLRKHLREIENIIYPLRGFKIEIQEVSPEKYKYHSQLNLFENSIVIYPSGLLLPMILGVESIIFTIIAIIFLFFILLLFHYRFNVLSIRK